MSTIPNIPRKIFNFFTEQAEELAIESQFKKRSSKCTPSAFVKALISTCFSQRFSLESFCSALKEQNVIVTKQSLFERFNEHTAAFLKSLALLGLNHFKTQKLPQLKCLDHFTAVNLSDSSTVSLHQSLSELFKGCGGAASSAALKIQLMYDYLIQKISSSLLSRILKRIYRWILARTAFKPLA